MVKINCPICDSKRSKLLFNLNCGKFDDSVIYDNIRIVSCENCCHIYNELSSEEINKLQRYYLDEYVPLNSASLDSCGFRPGSEYNNSLSRYEYLFKIIEPLICDSTRILDIGCALGGFVRFLNSKGYKNVFGIDVNIEEMDNIKLGSIYDVPFKDKFDVIVLDHVLEHLPDLKKVFKEVKRVLTDDGIVVIGVPDAVRYNSLIFWFSMKEHVQHFSIETLELLCNLKGFSMMCSDSSWRIMTEDNYLPNLICVFKKKVNVLKFEYDKLLQINNKINEFIKTNKTIYCYGIGREFLYYFNNTDLKYYDKLYLVDDTILKQNKFTLNERKIVGSSILKTASKDSILLIIPTIHRESMKEKVLKYFKGEIICLITN